MFSSLQKETLHPLAELPVSSFPQPPASTASLGFAYSAHFLQTEPCRMWCWRLPSFTEQNVLKFIPAVHVSMFPFFLWPNNIHRVDKPHFLYPFNRHLGCFRFLVIMNNGVINLCVQLFAWTHFHFFWVYFF